MDGRELVESDAWKVVSEELWLFWKRSMSELRKSKLPVEITVCQTALDITEKLLLIPAFKFHRKEDQDAYIQVLTSRQDKFMRSLMNEGAKTKSEIDKAN